MVAYGWVSRALLIASLINTFELCSYILTQSLSMERLNSLFALPVVYDGKQYGTNTQAMLSNGSLKYPFADVNDIASLIIAGPCELTAVEPLLRSTNLRKLFAYAPLGNEILSALPATLTDLTIEAHVSDDLSHLSTLTNLTCLRLRYTNVDRRFTTLPMLYSGSTHADDENTEAPFRASDYTYVDQPFKTMGAHAASATDDITDDSDNWFPAVDSHSASMSPASAVPDNWFPAVDSQSSSMSSAVPDTSLAAHFAACVGWGIPFDTDDVPSGHTGEPTSDIPPFDDRGMLVYSSLRNITTVGLPHLSPSLKTLDIDDGWGNSIIIDCSVHSLDKLSQLQSLTVSGCTGGTLPPSLKILRLNGDSYTNCLDTLTNLTDLRIRNCSIMTLPERLYSISDLDGAFGLAERIPKSPSLGLTLLDIADQCEIPMPEQWLDEEINRYRGGYAYRNTGYNTDNSASCENTNAIISANAHTLQNLTFNVHSKIHIDYSQLTALKFVYVNGILTKTAPSLKDLLSLRSLTNIYMYQVNLDDWEELGYASSAEIIGLQWCNMKDMPASICNLTNLRILTITKCPIRSIHHNISVLTNLVELSIENPNPLHRIIIPQSLCRLTATLKVLNISTPRGAISGDLIPLIAKNITNLDMVHYGYTKEMAIKCATIGPCAAQVCTCPDHFLERHKNSTLMQMPMDIVRLLPNYVSTYYARKEVRSECTCNDLRLQTNGKPLRPIEELDDSLVKYDETGCVTADIDVDMCLQCGIIKGSTETKAMLLRRLTRLIAHPSGSQPAPPMTPLNVEAVAPSSDP